MTKTLHNFVSFFSGKKNEPLIKTLKTASLFFLMFFWVSNVSAQVMQRNPNVVVGELIKIIPSLKDLKPEAVNTRSEKENEAREARDEKVEEAQERISPIDYGTKATGDPVVQKSLVAQKNNANAPNSPDPPAGGSAMLNFDGMSFSGFAPADPTMCAGPNHIIQMINGPTGGSDFKIWNRNGVQILAQSTMFTITGGLYLGDGDPVALYDQFANRFMITEFGEPTAGSPFINTLIIAVSQTADPTGGWFVYRFVDNTFFVDYPHWGIWPNVLYATSNDFNTAATAYLGSSVYAFNKVKMIAGNPTAEVQRFRLNDGDNRYISIAPVSISGPTPPAAGSPGMFVYYNDDNFTASPADVDSISILSLQPDFATPANTTLSFQQGIAVAAFKSRVCGNSRACVPGGSSYDAVSDRIMNRVYFRKFGSSESLVLNHTVDANFPTTPTKAGLRWYEFKRTTGAWSINQQSTFSPDADGRWMGTININSQGQIALAYNHSGTGKFASIYFAGRQAGDAANTLTVGDQLIKAGTAYGTFGNRWGDYNDLAADVNNDSLFWTTSMYGNAASAWATRIAAFKLLPCTGPQVLTNPVDVTICVGGNATYTASATNGTITFKWEVSSDAGNTFTPLTDGGVYSGTSTGTLTITGATAGLNGNYYRCNFANACTNTAYSTPGKLNAVSQIVVSPAAATICGGIVQPLAITFGGTPGPVGGTGIWSPVTDLFTNAAATTAYTGTAINTVYCKPTATRTYSVTPSGGACSATPTNVTVTVSPTPTVTAPTVTQPACPVPTTGTIVVNATGPGTLEYNLNGGTWQTSNTFTGLAAGNYNINVRIQSSPACVATWSGNPIIINPPNTATTTFSYTGPAVAIPDNNAAGVNITLPVSGLTGTIVDVNFRLDAAPGGGCDNVAGNVNSSVDHTFNGDLNFTLRSPGGTTIPLITSRGGSGNNFCTVLLDDDGGFPTASTIPTTGGVAGNFAPESPLSGYDGQAANGNWILNVSDIASTDVGNLRRFSIIITTSSPCTAPGPTVTINQAAAQVDPTSVSPVNFTVVFSAPVTGFLTGDVVLSGTAGATTGTVTGSGATYNVAVSGMSASGTVIATIPAGVAIDGSSNANQASTSTDNSVLFNLVAVVPPTVTIDQAAAQADPTAVSPINFTVVFSEPVSGFITGDVTLSGTAGATTGTVTGSGTTYNVAVSGMTASGTVITTIALGVATGTISALGNLASTSTDNSVTYNLPACIITCPANITTNATAGQCGAIVNYPAPVVIGSCGTVTSTPASGSFFPVGTTTVNVVSSAGPVCSFTVRVNDNQPPSITCPANITVSNTLNQCGANVTFTPTATDNCSVVSLTQSTSTAITAANSVSCNAGGIHRDNSYWRAYQLAAAAPVTINNVTFGIESANAAGTGTTQPVNVRLYTSAGAFPGGVRTQVASQTFNIPDQTNTLFTATFTTPSTVPGNAILVVELNTPDAQAAGHSFFIGTNTAAETGPSYLSATACGITTPTTTTAIGFPNMHIILNASGSLAVPAVSVPASGSFFPIGTTTVTSTATDAAGNSASCTFTVRVNDTQAPTITCPANITVTTPVGSCVAAVTYTVTATDNCPGVTTVRTAGLASGANFPIGVTTVTYTATDAAGNVSTCSFTVTVVDAQLPVISTGGQPVNRTVCTGANATFSVTATNAVSYQWQQFIAGVWTNITGATGATLTLNAVTVSMNTNSYRVNVTGLCSTLTSGFASLYVNPLPTISLTATNPPVLLPTQTTSISANVNPTGGTFAWFKDGVPRVPAVTIGTLSNLGVEDAGTYRAVYTDLNGCVNTSENIVISAEPSDRLFIAPNPNFGQFTVRYYNQPNEQLVLRVFNSKGALVYNRKAVTTLAYTRMDVSLGNNAPGVYLVELRRTNGQLLGSRKIIVGHP